MTYDNANDTETARKLMRSARTTQLKGYAKIFGAIVMPALAAAISGYVSYENLLRTETTHEMAKTASMLSAGSIGFGILGLEILTGFVKDSIREIEESSRILRTYKNTFSLLDAMKMKKP